MNLYIFLSVLGLYLCVSRCDPNVIWSTAGSGLDDGPQLSDASLCLPQPHTQQSGNCNSSDLWKIEKNGSCVCGNTLKGIVSCKSNWKAVGVLQCYCMYNSTSEGLIVGACLPGCFIEKSKSYLYAYYSSSDDLNDLCENFNRTGPFCGNCSGSDRGLPAYSFSLKCRRCTGSWKNIAKYIAIAYGPLTIFIVLIVVFTVSVNSAPLHGYIFVAQILALPITLRIFKAIIEIKPLQGSSLIAFGATVYGFWNLDFFRFANPDYFCLHPSLSTLGIMSLDYLIALYPLIIIVLMYVMVESHGWGYRVLVFLWKPFSCCFVRFRHRLNIKTSLVDAFVTFFSLSYVKSLGTTVDLMVTTPVWDVNGTHLHSRVYYDGTMHFFKGRHVIYAVISLTCFLFFNLLPIIFLLLYPRRFFQRAIPNNVRRILHPFMDTLLGMYRDGTDGGCDCRYFAAVYPIAKIAIFSMCFVSMNSLVFVLITIVTTITAMMVAVLKPYKSSVYNTVDTILISLLALTYGGWSSFLFAYALSKQQLTFSRILAIFPMPFPFFYLCGLVLYKIGVIFKLYRRSLRALQWIILRIGRAYISLSRKINRGREMEDIPSLNERTLLI